MNSEIIILIFIVICIGVLLIGTGFCIRRFPYLLSGFNKLTEEEKKSQKIKDSIAFTSKLFIRAGFCTCVGSVFSLIIKSDSLFLFFLFAPVLIACLFIIVNNTIHIPYKKKSNISSLFIVIVISVSIPFFFIYCSQEPTIEIDNDNIRIKCIYGETINRKEITEIVLSEQIPHIKLRTNGYSFNGIKIGYFLTQKGDIIKLFLFNSQKPCICIKLRTERVIFLNFKEYEKTIGVYNRICSFE